jgi:hypothetical protein
VPVPYIRNEESQEWDIEWGLLMAARSELFAGVR